MWNGRQFYNIYKYYRLSNVTLIFDRPIYSCYIFRQTDQVLLWNTYDIRRYKI